MNIKNLIRSVRNVNKEELVQHVHNLLCNYDFLNNNYIIIPVYVEMYGYYKDFEIQNYFNDQKQMYGYIWEYGNLYVDLNSLSVFTLLQLCCELENSN